MQKIIQMLVNAILTVLIERLGKPAYEAVKNALALKKVKQETAEKVDKLKKAKDETSVDSAIDDI